MTYEITSYNFFRTIGGGADFVKDGKLFHLSAEMLNCMINQYRIMGFRVIFDDNCFVSVSKAENEVENFLEKLAKKA